MKDKIEHLLSVWEAWASQHVENDRAVRDFVSSGFDSSSMDAQASIDKAHEELSLDIAAADDAEEGEEAFPERFRILSDIAAASSVAVCAAEDVILLVRLRNLTPHEVVLCGEEGKHIVTIPSMGCLRCTQERRLQYFHASIPMFVTSTGNVADLPPLIEGVIYIVSGLVRSACPDRKDFYQPGELLRDSNGQVVGCIGLSK